ncbi:Alcohol dehydrogenase [Pararobbsia alpina]|uniref:zinc-dependent alcohol dehydrogenase family protein n=1 Tax=Pararobbsia alpina TaxID=621374 RepID=UPI0039A4C987
MQDTMRRWALPSLGLGNLSIQSVDMPQPGIGELLVAVEAVSLNYRDAEVAEHGMGVALPFPFTPASDMAGRVVGVGPGVTRFAVGDRVISTCITGWIDGAPKSWADAPTQGGPIQGMLSEYVTTNAEWCVRAPQSLTPFEASTLPIAGLTAWMALMEVGHLRAGQTVVVQGTGGVSLFALQLALANGAQVIVTTSSDDKMARAHALGAQFTIDRRETPEWQDEVLIITGGRGADHILEMAGGDNGARCLQAICPGGNVSVIGLLESDSLTLPLMPLLGSRARITGISVGPRRALEDLVRTIDLKGIVPIIDAIYPFEQAPQAFEHLKRGAFGKVVVQVADFT